MPDSLISGSRGRSSPGVDGAPTFIRDTESHPSPIEAQTKVKPRGLLSQQSETEAWAEVRRLVDAKVDAGSSISPFYGCSPS